MPTSYCQNPSLVKLPNLLPIAKKVRLVIRDSNKFCPEVFLTTLIKSSITGKGSFREIATSLNQSLPGMSKQACAKRFSPKSTAFLQGVLSSLIEQRLEPVRKPLLNASIKRVIIEDATSLKMNKKNAENFPAHGNSHGKTAGVKVDLAYDLMSGKCASLTIEKATEQDKSIGNETITAFQEGDLIIRDMGYFAVAGFEAIESVGGYWLSRLPVNCNASSLDGKSLEKLLKETAGSTLDIEIKLGDGGQHPCRLIAIRAEQKIVEQRRRKRKEKAEKEGRAACSKGLVRDGWHIMVTSLKSEEATVSELALLYSARWAIELQFRALKKEINLKNTLKRITNQDHHLALILAALIAQQLSMKLWNIYYPILEGKSQMLSLEKLMGNVTQFLLGINTLNQIHDFDPDLRHIAYEKRVKRSSLINQAFAPLG